MKRICILLISVLTIVNITGYGQNLESKSYYYYKNERIQLNLNTDYIFVLTLGSDSIQDLDLLKILSTNLKKLDYSDRIKSKLNESADLFWAEAKLGSNVTSMEYNDLITKIKGYKNIQLVSPYFSSNNNKKIALSNFFYVKIKSLSDTIVLKEYSKNNNVIIVKQDDFMPLWFILSCTRNTTGHALDLANKFHESGLFQYAEPDLMLENILTIDDPYYGQQWGLKNIGQYGGTSGIDIRAENAWKIVTGAGSKIAVFDVGIQLNHPDLQANINPTSWDSETSSSPSVVRGDHATSVAGIAGALGNTIGIKGVSPNCSIISISSTMNLLTPNIRQKLANGINWAYQNGADVINNSWGSNDLASSYIDNAITNALSLGRSGKGTVVVFSAGNSNDSIIYPAKSNPGILAVGAMSECGQRKSPNSCDTETAWGSCFGSQLDVVAPGVLVPTTDRTGNDGYNPNTPIHPWSGGSRISSDYSNVAYTVWFNGTSAAAPHVSGLASLIISINSALTGQQVRDIIEQTSRKVGTYTYSTRTGRNNGTWNIEMGYGLIDACGASLQAYRTKLSITGNYVLLCTPTPYTISGVPTNSTLSWNCSTNIAKISTPGSNPFNFQANGAGPGWIEATLNTDCGNVLLNRYNVWVGKFESTVVTGTAAVCPNSIYTYTAQVPGGHKPEYSYSWTYPTTWTKIGQNQNNVTLQTPIYNMTYGAVRVAITNQCGTSGYSGITVYPKSGCGGYFMMFPNPASEEVTLSIADLYSNIELSDTNKVNVEPIDLNNYVVNIYSSQGNLNLTLKRSGKTFTIPLNTLKDGIYIVEVINGKISDRNQLIVKRKR